MSIPRGADFFVAGTLDEIAACELFLDKTLQEAELLFATLSSLTCMEYLGVMGTRAFQYYIVAAINYIQSDLSSDDPDCINGFAGMLEQRLEEDTEVLEPLAVSLTACCTHILRNWERFQVDAAFYGDLMTRVHSLRQRIMSLKK